MGWFSTTKSAESPYRKDGSTGEMIPATEVARLTEELAKTRRELEELQKSHALAFEGMKTREDNLQRVSQWWQDEKKGRAADARTHAAEIVALSGKLASALDAVAGAGVDVWEHARFSHRGMTWIETTALVNEKGKLGWELASVDDADMWMKRRRKAGG